MIKSIDKDVVLIDSSKKNQCITLVTSLRSHSMKQLHELAIRTIMVGINCFTPVLKYHKK